MSSALSDSLCTEVGNGELGSGRSASGRVRGPDLRVRVPVSLGVGAGFGIRLGHSARTRVLGG